MWKDFGEKIKEILSKRRIFVVIGVILLVLAVIAEAIFQWNRLSSTSTAATARRAGIERELQRRQNLIPNLVQATAKYALHEQMMFKYVCDARDTLKSMQESGAAKIPAGDELARSMSKLIALAEQYPDLKATQSIQDLIKEASETENRIAQAKNEYHAAAETFNLYCTVFPGNVFMFIYGYKLMPYEGTVESMAVPKIDLSSITGGLGQVPGNAGLAAGKQ